MKKIVSAIILFLNIINFHSWINAQEQKTIDILEAYYGVPRPYGLKGLPQNKNEFWRMRSNELYVDVKNILEKIIQPLLKEGKNCLVLSKNKQGEDWMNDFFGDPAKGITKNEKSLLIIYTIYTFGGPMKRGIIAVPEYEDLVLPLTYTPGELEIISAKYGVIEQKGEVKSKVQTDVTAKLKNLILGDCYYHVKEDGWMNKAFGDPTPGKDKTLEVKYKIHGKEYNKSIDEDDALLISDFNL